MMILVRNPVTDNEMTLLTKLFVLMYLAALLSGIWTGRVGVRPQDVAEQTGSVGWLRSWQAP